MKKLLLFIALQFLLTNAYSQYQYSYDGILVSKKSKKKDSFVETKIDKKGTIDLKENHVSIDNDQYSHCLTKYNEKISGRYVDSCCQTFTDQMLNTKTSEYYIFYSRYKNYRLVDLTLMKKYHTIQYLNIKAR